jgi:hypothetical protein
MLFKFLVLLAVLALNVLAGPVAEGRVVIEGQMVKRKDPEQYLKDCVACFEKYPKDSAARRACLSENNFNCKTLCSQVPFVLLCYLLTSG